MAIDTDLLIDRRRLKQRLTFWRLAATVFFIAAVIGIVGSLTKGWFGGHVARLHISGVITDDQDRDDALARVAKDHQVKALIVIIDSPGGTVVGGQSLYGSLRATAEQKPVVVVMGDVATSAAYMTALGADRIFAREGTVTGSIGVILQTADVTELLDRLGIKPETIKSTALKAQPNPLEPLSHEAREATRKVVLDIYDSFVALVRDRRGFTREQVALVADGRIFTGRQALANGLIDEIGGESEARAWLKSSHGIDPDLPTRDVETEGPEEQLSDLFGGMLTKALSSERLSLDRAVSLWHPSF